jgi:hypothetical protein
MCCTLTGLFLLPFYFTHISYVAPFVGRVVALVLKGNNYKCILFDDEEMIEQRYTLMHLQLPVCVRRLVVIPRSPLSRLAQALPPTALASVSITPRQEARSRANWS